MSDAPTAYRRRPLEPPVVASEDTKLSRREPPLRSRSPLTDDTLNGVCLACFFVLSLAFGTLLTLDRRAGLPDLTIPLAIQGKPLATHGHAWTPLSRTQKSSADCQCQLGCARGP